MKSGIQDKDGKEIKAGDKIGLFYVDPMGKMHGEIDSVKEVIFKHGCYGYLTHTRFVPLLNWATVKTGKYISNEGNIEIISDRFNFTKLS